jgi:hypothetical protein
MPSGFTPTSIWPLPDDRELAQALASEVDQRSRHHQVVPCDASQASALSVRCLMASWMVGLGSGGRSIHSPRRASCSGVMRIETCFDPRYSGDRFSTLELGCRIRLPTNPWKVVPDTYQVRKNLAQPDPGRIAVRPRPWPPPQEPL